MDGISNAYSFFGITFAICNVNCLKRSKCDKMRIQFPSPNNSILFKLFQVAYNISELDRINVG